MGQIVQTDDLKFFVDSNITAFIDQVTSPYARLFGKSPTFVTYYSQDRADSTVDVNLGGVIEFAGPESPTKFVAVRNLPVYGITPADLTTAYDDINGISTGSVQGEIILLPNTVEPVENDYFVVNYLTVKLAFRIKQADSEYIEGKSFWKLQYFLDTVNVDDIIAQTTSTMLFEMKNYGTTAIAILAEDFSLLIKELTVVEDSIKAAYWRAFYNRASCSLILQDAYPKPVHCQCLDLFVAHTSILSSQRYLGAKFIAIADIDDRGIVEDVIYPNTVYGNAERGTLDSDDNPNGPVLDGMLLATTRPVSAGSQFFEAFALLGFMEAIPIRCTDSNGAAPIGWRTILADARSVSFETLDPLRQLTIKSLTGAFRLNDIISYDNLKAFIELLNNRSIMINREAFFWLAPIVLAEAQRLKVLVQRTN